MNKNMEKLLKLASKDEELSAKLQKAEKQQVVELAKKHGIILSDADFEVPKGKVSDDELQAVAGGGNCYCAMGGGGSKGEGERACACVIVGLGYYTDGSQRCGCPGFGAGED